MAAENMLEQVEQGLQEGRTLEEMAAVLEADQSGAQAEPAQAGAAPEGAKPDGEPSAEQKAPAADASTDPDLESVLNAMPAEQRDAVRAAIETQRRKWESGATPKFQAAAQYDALLAAFQTHPQETLAFLGARFGAKPTQDHSPAQPAQPTYEARLAAIRAKALNPQSTPEEQWAAMEELADLKAERAKLAAEARVSPLEKFLATDADERQIAEVERDYPELNVRGRLAEVRRVQAAVRERPHLFPREALAILALPGVMAELRQFKAAAARPSTTAAKVAAQVAGPRAGAPRGFDPATLDLTQLGKLLVETGVRPQ